MHRQASFQIDSIANTIFTGYTDDGEWNGFDRPLFDFEAAQQVLAQSHKNGFSWQYDLQSDFFSVIYDRNLEDEAEVFAGENIIVEGKEVHVYPVGAGSWMWNKLEALTA